MVIRKLNILVMDGLSRTIVIGALRRYIATACISQVGMKIFFGVCALTWIQLMLLVKHRSPFLISFTLTCTNNNIAIGINNIMALIFLLDMFFLFMVCCKVTLVPARFGR
jgi:hypothetical protein